MMHHLLTAIHHYHNFSTISPPPILSPSASPIGPQKMAFHTAFYWGKAHQVLFPGWPGSSTAMYILAVFLVSFLAILIEFLSYFPLIKPGGNRAAACLFRTGMHSVRAGVSYMVILAILSYNAGIFIAAVVGHAVGYVIFGSGILWKPDVSSSSNTVAMPAKF